jgi:hypothetical protein
VPTEGSIGNTITRRWASLAVVIGLALGVACGGVSEGAVSPSCADFEVVGDRTGLISRSEAEQMAVERLSMSAPEVSPTEVERVWASCLTTYGSYQEQFYREGDWTNPELRPPDTPVWIVEVKGISRPAGIATASAHVPYHYAMGVRNARNGEMMEGARYQQPRLQPAPEE